MFDEFRQEREHILEDHNHDKSDDQQAVFDNGVNAAAELFHDDEIHELKDDQYQSDEPDAETLLEVFLEGLKEASYCVRLLIPHKFQCYIIHRS